MKLLFSRDRGAWYMVLKCLLYLLPAITLAWMVLYCSAPVPKEDDYDAILSYLNIPQNERLWHIADFHNEHRILTARLVFEIIVRTMGHFDFTVCMAIGAVFLFGYGLLFKRLFTFGGVGVRLLGFAFFWLIVSFLNYDNVCWAMTSVSNVPVHFWALLSLFLARKRKRVVFFGLSLLCAVLATFSTGAGMSIWGALAVMSIHDRLRKYGGWKNFFLNLNQVVRLERSSAIRLCVGSVVCLCSISVYFHGFHSVSPEHGFSIKHAVLTFTALSGAIVPILSIALSVGIGTILVVGWIIWRMPRIHNVTALAFLSYMLAGVLAAAIFRSYDPLAVLACRMRIVPISLLGTAIVLLTESLPFTEKNIRRAAVAVFVGTLAYLTAFTAVAYRSLMEQKDRLLNGIMAWPHDISGLSLGACNNVRFDAILRKSVDSGVYYPPESK